MSDSADIKRQYRRFADVECRGYSEVYYQLALAVSEDDDVVAFIAGMPVTQPNLFFASIQLLTGPDGMSRTGSDVRAFLKERGREVGDVMRARRTQTNEVARCAVLLPALPPGSLALLEVGASAGPCLLLDRFLLRIRFDAHRRRVLARACAVHGRGARAASCCGSARRVATRPRCPSDRRARRSCDPVCYWRACGRITMSAGDGSKVRSTWRGPVLPWPVLTTWSMTFPRCWLRRRTMPSSSSSTLPC